MIGMVGLPAVVWRLGATWMATLEGFEPSFSTLKGWRAGPLHHRVKNQVRVH
jgi:hypothetical protein